MSKRVPMVGWHPTVVEHFLVFERRVDTVHDFAPRARIAFNTGSTDPAAAIQRWA